MCSCIRTSSWQNRNTSFATRGDLSLGKSHWIGKSFEFIYECIALFTPARLFTLFNMYTRARANLYCCRFRPFENDPHFPTHSKFYRFFLMAIDCSCLKYFQMKYLQSFPIKYHLCKLFTDWNMRESMTITKCPKNISF